MSGIVTRIRKQPAWLALAIFVLLCVWIASGSLSESASGPEKKVIEAPIPKVQTTLTHAEKVSREITLYGRTEPDRIATLRAEVQGQVTEIFVKEGQTVKAGQKLIAIDDNDLKQRISAAKANLSQRQIELKGAQSLGQKGYQSEVALAQAKANVEDAVAQLKGLELALRKTVFLAPFDGVLNERMVEIGDLVRDGDGVVTVVDLDPLVIEADVTENDISHLSLGQQALGRMVSGEILAGSIRYLSSISNPGTNTFKIEVQVDNPQGKYVAGLSTELAIPLNQTWAIKISPAVMALDEQGNLGVKTVQDGKVNFVPIDIVKSDSEGVWLAGLGEQAEIITLGHGYVKHGDVVEATVTNADLQAKR